jgi:hypothetical protein
MKNLDTFSVNDNKFSLAMEFSMYCNEKVNFINNNLVSCIEIIEYFKKPDEPWL